MFCEDIFMNNKIIAISGMDASGKSTLSLQIQKELESRNIPYIVTKQPCKSIREWTCFNELLKNESEDFDFKTVGGLISWGRLNTQIREIIPALEAGYYVLCERYILDIAAWSRFRGAKDSWIEEWTAALLRADVSILCDAEPELVWDRIRERKEGKKIGENSLENISRIIGIYRDEAKKNNSVIFDSSRDVEEVKKWAHDLIEEMIS